MKITILPPNNYRLEIWNKSRKEKHWPKSWHVSKKSPTGPTERTPEPEYLIALVTYLGVRWRGPIYFLMECWVPCSFLWERIMYLKVVVEASKFMRKWKLDSIFPPLFGVTIKSISPKKQHFQRRKKQCRSREWKFWTLRITGPCYSGVWMCIAGVWDLQTTSFEIPWFLGKYSYSIFHDIRHQEVRKN